MITIFNASIIQEDSLDPHLIVSYYDDKKQQFEKLRTKLSHEFIQGLKSGYNQLSDIESIIEEINVDKELLTKEEVKEIYDDLFINNKTGHSTRYKVSSEDESIIKAKNVFINKKLSDLGN